MILSLTFARSLGFQHFPRDLANVNEWKIMFDPSITNTDHKETIKLTKENSSFPKGDHSAILSELV